MKIKNQFLICIGIFSIILIVITASAAITDRDVRQLNNQGLISGKIERSVSSLSSVAIDYFLYQEDLQLTRWTTIHSTLHNELSELKLINPQQQNVIKLIDDDLHGLNNSFSEVVSYLQMAPRNVSIRIEPKFQIIWSDVAAKSEKLASDASQLSFMINEQTSQTQLTNTLLIVSLVVTFGALLATVLIIVFQRTLKSVIELQKGIDTIGSGDLDYVIQAKRRDEISDLSYSFNEMTGKLKTVTASKAELEKEISERKKVEDELKKLNDELEERIQQRTGQLVNERKRLYDVLETLPVMICLLTPDHHIIFANRTFREKFGESEGRPCYDYCFGKKQPCSFCESFQVLETGKPHRWKVKAPDGSVIDAYDFPFTDTDGSSLILEMDIDITESERLERQLQDSERLATIGATASMVGHDMRNPLQAISGDLYFAKKDLEKIPESPLRQSVNENLASAEESVTYLNKIVQDLQDYASPIRLTMQQTDLEALCNEVLFRRDLPKNIFASCHVEEDAKIVSTDSLILKRILNNLTSNAVQAMPNGGKVSLVAKKNGEDLIVTVEDTGIGIPQEVHPKLFTPMFTTKAKGQGFGLVVVKRMTEALGGKVTFETEPGVGSKFHIHLPQTPK